jgi:hypothetical protein
MIMRVFWHKRRWNVTLAAVAAVLVIACWIAYSDRRPISALGPSTLQRSIAIEQQAPSLSAKARPAKSTSELQTKPVPVRQARVASTNRQRVRVGENEVEYIGEDVTVRYFTPPKPAPHRVRVGENEVAYMGEDVTVRYFTAKPAVVPPQPVGSAAPPVGRSRSVQR